MGYLRNNDYNEPVADAERDNGWAWIKSRWAWIYGCSEIKAGFPDNVVS